MNELKTLKDIPLIRVTNEIEAMQVISNNNVLYEKDLKQSAIKWVKDNLKDCKSKIVRIDGGLISFKHNVPKNLHNKETEQHHYLMGRICVLIEFFNITKEDLK